MINPALIIGLGKYGSEVSNNIYDYIKENDKNIFKIVKHLTLTENGDMNAESMDIEQYDFTGLKSEMQAENYQYNYNYIIQREDEFKNILSHTIDNIRQQKTITLLEENGYKIGSTIKIYIVSTLFDPIGSSALIPFLGFIQSLFSSGKLGVASLEINIIGLFPDLFEGFESDDTTNQFYKRSYACLQELDFVGDNPRFVSPNEENPFNYIYLFNSKNENAIQVGNYQELTVMISEFLITLLNGSIAKSMALEPLLIRKVNNKTTRYCSFGLNKLCFPVEIVMNGISDYIFFHVLNHSGKLNMMQYSKYAISQEIKKYLYDNKYDQLDNELNIDVSGNKIWENFRYSVPINKNTRIESFLMKIEQEVHDFKKSKMIQMNIKLSAKLEDIFKYKQANLVENINGYIDDNSKEIYYCKAFMDILLEQESSLITGDSTEETLSLNQIEYKIKDFFSDDIKKKKKDLENLENEIKINVIELNNKVKIDEENIVDEEFNNESSGDPSIETEPDNDNKSISENLEEADDLVETEDLIEGGDSEEIESETNEETETLSEKIKGLKNKYQKLKKEVESFYQNICESVFREKILNDNINELNSGKTNIISEYEANEEELKGQINLLEDLYRQRKNFIQQKFVIIPIIVFFIYSLLIYGINLLFSISFFNIIKNAIPILLFGLIIYGLIYFIILKNGILNLIVNTESKIRSLENLKVNLFLRFQDIENNILKTRYNFNLYGNLLDKFKQHKINIMNMREQLTGFINNLNKGLSEKENNWKNLTFPSTIFVQSIITKKEILEIVEKNPRLPIFIKEFFSKNLLSGYFNSFKNSNNLNKFYDDISIATESIFKEIREKSVEDILKEGSEDNYSKIDDKLSNYFNSAKANILLDVEEGLDKSHTLPYLGILNPEDSFAKNRLHKIYDENILAYSIDSKYEIVFAKLKIGFPAFHIKSVKYGKHNLEITKNKDSFYLNPEEWEVEDLIPSLYTIGDEQDESRKIACISRALKFITSKGKEFHFKKDDVDIVIGKSYKNVVDFLRSFKGNSIRNKLFDLIELEKEKETTFDRLTEYSKKNKLDDIDKKILEEILDELNPLA